MWNSLLIQLFLIDYSHQVSAPLNQRTRVRHSILVREHCWLSLKSIDIATEAEPQTLSAGTRRQPNFQQGNRLSTSTKQLIRKMIFPIMTVIYTICICLLSKERVDIQSDSYYMSHTIWLIWSRSWAYYKSQTVSEITYGSEGDRYLKKSWKGKFLSGHSRWLSPRFYFTWTTLERLFQTYYKCTGLAHLDCYFDLADVHWHHTTSYYQVEFLFE